MFKDDFIQYFGYYKCKLASWDLPIYEQGTNLRPKKIEASITELFFDMPAQTIHEWETNKRMKITVREFILCLCKTSIPFHI